MRKVNKQWFQNVNAVLDLKNNKKHYIQTAIFANDVSAVKAILGPQDLSTIFGFKSLTEILFRLVRNDEYNTIIDYIFSNTKIAPDKLIDPATKTSLLCEAAYYGANQNTKLLLELGSNPNYKDPEKNLTPLPSRCFDC